MKTIIIIPARLQSKRLDRKLLLPGPGGKPLLYFTWKQAKDSNVEEVYIASDSAEIFEEAIKFGATVIMTKTSHNCGTNRIEEAYDSISLITRRSFDCIINLQGDEPEIRGRDINLLINEFEKWTPNTKHPWKIATLAVPFYSFEQYSLPQNVKVVFNENDNEAIYFSRGMIPWVDNVHGDLEWRMGTSEKPIAHKHLGIYAYTPEMLRQFIKTSASRLEEIEGLEQMRAIEYRWPILVVSIDAPGDNQDNIWPLGINTNEDYKLWQSRSRVQHD